MWQSLLFYDSILQHKFRLISYWLHYARYLQELKPWYSCKLLVHVEASQGRVLIITVDKYCRNVKELSCGEKTGGKIIHRAGGVLYLFCGRNYNYCNRPQYPVMLWKPATPVYPKLIQEAPEGLTKFEADNLRMKGESLLPICKLAKNGTYNNLVNDVRNAFEGSSLVKVNCQGMHATDYKKLGVKLKELVPCALLSFDDEQILMWRGKDWKSIYPEAPSSESDIRPSSSRTPPDSDELGKTADVIQRPCAKSMSTCRLINLWKRALESSKALLLDEITLGPDALLEKVEEFEDKCQAKEHSYPALILSTEDNASPKTDCQNNFEFEIHDSNDENDPDVDENEEYDGDLLEGTDSSVPRGSLPVDSLAEQLGWE